MRRILVTGNSGSGKSTVARALGRILDLPVVHLDRLYWNPGWVATPDDEFERKITDALASNAWVCDGNYSRFLDLRLARADTFIFLDLPRRVCVWRVLKRRGPRPDLPPDCPERRTTKDFYDFITKWVWTYPRRSRPTVLEHMRRHRDTKTVVHLPSQAAVDRYLSGLASRR